jgi:hypothetical protein
MKRLAALLVLLGASTASANFSGFTYEQAVTISSANVTNIFGTVTNFPVPFVSTNVVFSTATSGGHMTGNYDLVASSDPSCASQYWLDWDTETFNNGVAGSTFTAWVKIPVLTTATLTAATYYWCYGNSSITSYQGNSTSTWDSNFAAVYHLNTLANDSTGNAGNLTNHSAAEGTGQIDGGAVFSGNYFTGSAASITGNITIEFWFNTSVTSAQGVLTATSVSTGGGTVNYAVGLQGTTSGLSSTFNGTANFPSGGGTDYSANTWNDVAIEANGTDVLYYLNGVLGATTAGTAQPSGGSNFLFVGQSDAFGDETYTGDLDEIRISKTLRNADWLTASYNSQHSPQTFSIEGAEQGGVVSVTSPSLTIQGGQFIQTGGTVVVY